jgi:hypothetical protein
LRPDERVSPRLDTGERIDRRARINQPIFHKDAEFDSELQIMMRFIGEMVKVLSLISKEQHII